MSNSKLNKIQKNWRKDLLVNLPDGFDMATVGRVTVLIVPAGAVSKISVSIASPDEKKLRRKVGEFHALNNMANGQFTIIPRGAYSAGSFAREFDALL